VSAGQISAVYVAVTVPVVVALAPGVGEKGHPVGVPLGDAVGVGLPIVLGVSVGGAVAVAVSSAVGVCDGGSVPPRRTVAVGVAREVAVAVATW